MRLLMLHSFFLTLITVFHMFSGLYPYLSLLFSHFVFFFFHLLSHSLFATRHILQVTVFDSISLQPARNISEIRNTWQSTTKKNCRVDHNQTNALTFSWNKVWFFPSSLSSYFLLSFWSGYRLKNCFLGYFNEHS